ncbi:hypothetical protein OCU04_005053 [Sclerotinia nivalis]|uniref:Sugar phosphate transporter domain-containing protein n=1 Tax=Sclerotinia nivalis TaxID=352851 RepID=A0A9X0ARS9_9HELO|nr:hypothetical protein OCU04_005053 [Sclerotinia nivalis]
MTIDLPPDSAWALNAMAPTKEGPTINITTNNGFSTFAAPTPPPASPAPPTVAPPKRNNGIAFSMVGGGGPASQPPTPSFAAPPPPPPVISSPANPPPPTVAPPKRNNGIAFSMVGGGPASQPPTPAFAPASAPPPSTYLPPPYIPSAFLPSTAVAIPTPYANPPSYTFSAFAPSTPASVPASTPTSFPSHSPFTSIPPSPFISAPLPPSSIPTTAQQPQSPSPTMTPMRFLPARPAAPPPADPPAPRFLFDGLNQRITEEMDSLNLLLTILNKRILAQYPYPWLLTAWHALCSSMGTYISRRLDPTNSNPEHRSRGKNHYILMFSVLYTVNIAVSNVSLGIMSIPDHVVLRSTIPILVLALTQLLHLPHKPYTPLTLLSLLPLTTGILLTTHNTLTLTRSTTPLPLLSTLLTASKTLSTQHLQTQLSLPPLQILQSIAPLTGIQATLWSYMNGEIDEFLIKQISSHNSPLTSSPSGLFLLLTNGIVAFLLNWSSFAANRKTGALTMAVLGNVKLVLAMVISGAVLSGAEPLVRGWMHGFGVLLALGGGFLYSLGEVGMFASSKGGLSVA